MRAVFALVKVNKICDRFVLTHLCAHTPRVRRHRPEQHVHAALPLPLARDVHVHRRDDPARRPEPVAPDHRGGHRAEPVSVREPTDHPPKRAVSRDRAVLRLAVARRQIPAGGTLYMKSNS